MASEMVKYEISSIENFRRVEKSRKSSVAEVRQASRRVAEQIVAQKAEEAAKEQRKERRRRRRRSADDAGEEVSGSDGEPRDRRGQRRSAGDADDVAASDGKPRDRRGQRRSAGDAEDVTGSARGRRGSSRSFDGVPGLPPIAGAEARDSTKPKRQSFFKQLFGGGGAAAAETAAAADAEAEADTTAATDDPAPRPPAAPPRPQRRMSLGSAVFMKMARARPKRKLTRTAAATMIQRAARDFAERRARDEAAHVVTRFFRFNRSWALREKWRWVVRLEAEEHRKREDTRMRVERARAGKQARQAQFTKRFMKAHFGQGKEKDVKLSKQERALAVLINLQRGWPGAGGAQDEAGWAHFHSELVIPGAGPGSRDRSAVRRLVTKMKKSGDLLNLELLKLLDEPALARWGLGEEDVKRRTGSAPAAPAASAD